MQSGSWSSYQAAVPPEARAGGEPDDEPPARCRPWKCSGCGRFTRREAGREYFVPESRREPAVYDWLCPECFAARPTPPTAEQVRAAERRDDEISDIIPW